MAGPACLLPLAPLTALINEGFHDTVHELGCGFAEAVCQNALAIVLRDKGLLVEPSYQLSVSFRGQNIGKFEADLLIERLVIVEVKAMARIEDWAKAQILNYLKCAGGGIGLLANFGRHPEIQRFVMGDPNNSLPMLSKAPVKDIGRWTKPPLA